MKFFKSKLSYDLVLIFFLTLNLIGFSGAVRAEKYLLCGPDEDGCYRDIYVWCSCIPYDELHGEQPYCLDFDELRCHPLSSMPGCSPSLTFKNQASCLGVIFQSEPTPGCKKTTRMFCERYRIPNCDMDGYPESCRS
ncbi:hypothetical protein BN59_01967 [Legionella massiliensis]|uniref:Uncharacterized protein n=1 Tax=Legionella massiliensis TaxID=1034943 RepID=A0A078KX95_9GAMM|nr:hypothetical protein [Legionella massiliensis]CDZ77677.1 hypothetical protein BN59_01967 [Legionella massiliensis]CEE13415.1 hypothetical protein BN1094_01967 [Legionella massiliensis]